MWICPSCKRQFDIPDDSRIICACGADTKTGNKIEPHKSPTQLAWVRWVKLLRKPEDKGVGDTIERMIASVGLDRWKTFSKKLGMPCNCDRRRDWLNETYPY